MINLKIIFLLTFLSAISQTSAVSPRKLAVSQIISKIPKQYRSNTKLVSRFLRLYQQGKKNLRKLQLNVKSELNEAKSSKNKRKLLMGLSGGQMIGLLGGLGGYYAYDKGMKDGELEFKKLKHEDKMKTFEIMMKTQQRDALVQQMNAAITELENRCDDLGSQVSNKIQEYDANLRRAASRY